MTAAHETEFRQELDIFRKEIVEAIQCFYIFQTVHNIARNDRRVYGILDKYADFWNATLRALQANSLIVLGRIFDRDSRSHNIGRLLQLAETHLQIFSKPALKERKRKQSTISNEALDSFIRDTYVPSRRDLNRLRQYAEAHRRIYNSTYRDVRNKFFAHRDRTDVAGLVAKTSTRKLEKLLVFLNRLHQALWNLFHNGLRPSLRPARYAAKRILEAPPSRQRNSSEQESITRETDQFLKYLAASGTNPNDQSNARPTQSREPC